MIDFCPNWCIIEADSTQDNTQVVGGVFLKDYKPPFTITNEILTYVSSISEKVGRIFGAAMIDWEQGGVLNPLLFLPRKFFPADWFSCDTASILQTCCSLTVTCP